MSIPNLNSYNIQTENELTLILRNFDEMLIYNIITQNIKDRLSATTLVAPGNIIGSINKNIDSIIQTYEGDREVLMSKKEEVFDTIIGMISENENISILTNDIEASLYSVASYAFEIFCMRYKEIIINFFSNIIIREKTSIYNYLNLKDIRKSKDSSTIYGKKLYASPEIAIINANLPIVLEYLLSVDCTFIDIISETYNNEITNFISTYFIENNNYYKNKIVPLFSDTSEFGLQLISEIRISIHNRMLINKQSVIEQSLLGGN